MAATIIYDEATPMTDKQIRELYAYMKKLLKNPKIRKELKGLLKPLKQEGDSLIIK